VSHTQKWKVTCPKLQRVQEKAQANKQEQFTSLAHHLTEEALLGSYRRLKASSAPGIDGRIWQTLDEQSERTACASAQWCIPG